MEHNTVRVRWACLSVLRSSWRVPPQWTGKEKLARTHVHPQRQRNGDFDRSGSQRLLRAWRPDRETNVGQPLASLLDTHHAPVTPITGRARQPHPPSCPGRHPLLAAPPPAPPPPTFSRTAHPADDRSSFLCAPGTGRGTCGQSPTPAANQSASPLHPQSPSTTHPCLLQAPLRCCHGPGRFPERAGSPFAALTMTHPFPRACTGFWANFTQLLLLPKAPRRPAHPPPPAAPRPTPTTPHNSASRRHCVHVIFNFMYNMLSRQVSGTRSPCVGPC